MELYKKINPKFSKDSLKGERGTILIIGGSDDYTGAPYFCAFSAFRAGAEMVYIFAGKSSHSSIKSLIPEAVVSEINYREWILKRITACVFGTGLGYISDEVKLEIKSILIFLQERKIPIIIDGDGLKYYKELFPKEIKGIFLTPNTKERKKTRWIGENHFLIEKGPIDIIQIGNDRKRIDEPGSEKRCGGLGDILVGILSVYLSWIDVNDQEKCIVAIECALRTTRMASKAGWKDMGMSLMTRDVLSKLSDIFKEVRGNK